MKLFIDNKTYTISKCKRKNNCYSLEIENAQPDEFLDCLKLEKIIELKDKETRKGTIWGVSKYNEGNTKITFVETK